MCAENSAVVDKRFVDKIGDKTAVLRKYDMSTKILVCQHNVLFKKRKDTCKTQNIDKISLQKAWLFAKSMLSRECSGMLDAQPATVYPGSPDDPSRNSEVWILVGTSLHLFPNHCFVDNCRRRDEIWPNMSTEKSVLDDGTSREATVLHTFQTMYRSMHFRILMYVLPCTTNWPCLDNDQDFLIWSYVTSSFLTSFFSISLGFFYLLE